MQFEKVEATESDIDDLFYIYQYSEAEAIIQDWIEHGPFLPEYIELVLEDDDKAFDIVLDRNVKKD